MPLTRIRTKGLGSSVSFNNINDTGTEGTKVASGTTAQRGTTTGQWRYNTTTNFFEGRNTSGTFSTLEPTPTITGVDDTEVDSAGGGDQTIVVTGTNFSSGGTITFVGNAGAEFNASTTTFNSATQVTAVAPKNSFLNAQEPYKVKFTSASGVSGTSAGLINVDNAPTWTTSAGSLGSIAENATGNHFTVAATDPESDTIAYSLQSGSLAGLSIDSSTGVISGDPDDVSGDTTNSFTLRATAGSKTADRAFSYITTNIPTFYDQIVTTQGLNFASRNLGILIDPYDSSSDPGSGSLTNRSGHNVANSSAALNGLTRGGTGTGKYWSVDSGSDSYIHFGNPTGLTNNTSDAWAYCGWWRPSWEVDDSGNSAMIWALNDGDWSPASQIGVRFGQGNGFRVHSGGTTDLLNVGIPSATYTNNWVFLCVWHRVSGGMYAGQAFATDTNLSDHITHSSYSSSTGNSSGHNLMIGARPDNTSEDTHDGTWIGPQAAWFGGGDSFVSTSENWSEARTQFEAIFDATKGRYA